MSERQEAMALISCEECGSEVSSKAKTCPKCGVRISARRSGCASLIVLAMGSVMLIPALMSMFGSDTGGGTPSLTETSSSVSNHQADQTSPPPAKVPLSADEKVENAMPSKVLPSGDLAEIFRYGSDFTDLQRELKLKELLGELVEWRLPVYDVRQTGDKYTIQTGSRFKGNLSERRVIGTFLRISPRGEIDKNYIEHLKTGDIITVKGLVKDSSLRNLEISPAILIHVLETKEVLPPKDLIDFATKLLDPIEVERFYGCTANHKPEKSESRKLFTVFEVKLTRDNNVGYHVKSNVKPFCGVYGEEEYLRRSWLIARKLIDGRAEYSVIFYSGRDGVSVLSAATNGYQDIETWWYNAVVTHTISWKYDGKEYVEFREVCSANLTNEEVSCEN